MCILHHFALSSERVCYWLVWDVWDELGCLRWWKVRVLCYLYHLAPCVISAVRCHTTLLGAQQAAKAAQRAAAAAAAAADSAEAAQNRAMRCREERELCEILWEFVSLLGTCGEQVMCWRYSCQNGYAILAQAVPPAIQYFRKTRSDLLVPPMAASSPVASETGTVGSFSLIGTDMDAGDDYMVLSIQVTEAAPAEVTTEFEDDPAITKETLASQLHEMEKVMANLGLEPKPETSVEASSGQPPSGFVHAEAQTPTQTLRVLEKETLTLHMDPTTETFTIEGWASLIPALPHSAAKYFRDITHGELRSLLDAFRSSPWTASLVVKIAEVYHISKREAVHTQKLKLRHTTQRGGSMVNLKEKDPGTSPQLVCSDCNAPWGQLSKCLLCQGSQPVDLSMTPLSVIEVAGQSWQLRLTEAGPTWVPSHRY